MIIPLPPIISRTSSAAATFETKLIATFAPVKIGRKTVGRKTVEERSGSNSK